MQLTLIPLNHAGLSPLHLSEGVLPVGRNVEPFCSYPTPITERLSRRHARIFLEHGDFFVADLGSKNGTAVNGSSIHGNAVTLKNGDRVDFAGALEYVADVSEQDDEEPTLAGSRELVLEPTRADSGLDRLVIRQFPVLIGKGNEPFNGLADTFPREVLFLSRRHAHIYTRGGQVYVEDLGSTNGTYVSSDRIDDAPYALRDGDVLSFGGDFFEYHVRLDGDPATRAAAQPDGQVDADRTMIFTPGEVAAEPAPGAEAVDAADQGDVGSPTDLDRAGEDPAPVDVGAAGRESPEARADRTTFVSSATSFLEIFCTDDEAGDGGAASAVAGAARDTAERTQRAATTGVWPRFAALLLLVGVVGASVWLLLGSQEKQLKEMIRQGQFLQAAQLGGGWLADGSGDESLRPLVTEAVLKHFVPVWQQQVEQKAFDRARATLADAATHVGSNTPGATLLDMLQWVTRLEELVDERGGIDAPIRLYRDEQGIREITTTWEADEADKRRRLDLIAVHVPPFGHLKQRAYSHVRGYQTSSSLYLQAIDDLSRDIAARLRQSLVLSGPARDQQLAAVAEMIENFAAKYPKVTGLGPLRQDLDAYRELSRLIDDGDLSGVIDHLAASQPVTPPFQAQRAYLLANALPGESFRNDYRLADAAWRQGHADEAVERLQRIVGNDWQSVAATALAHCEAVSRGYADLQQKRGGDDYGPALLTFYRQLGERDSFYRDALAEDYRAARQPVLEAARNAFEKARSLWNDYRDRGGIDGEMRVSRAVSTDFQEKARLLTAAWQATAEAMQAFASLGEPAEHNLDDEVRAEIVLQRQWLEDVEQIVGPAIIQEKLALLPEIAAQGGAQ